MLNLKTARKKGKIDDFIKKHEAEPEGDLDAALKRPAKGKKKATRPARMARAALEGK